MAHPVLHTTQSHLRAKDGWSGGSLELAPFSDAGEEDAASLRDIILHDLSGAMGVDVVRDFGPSVLKAYSGKVRKIIDRFDSRAQNPDLEAYVIRAREMAIGIATITLAHPRLKSPRREEKLALDILLPPRDKDTDPTAVVGTFWLGLPGARSLSMETAMQNRVDLSRAVARPLVQRMVEVGRGEVLPAVTFEVPLSDGTSPSAGLREVMTATSLVACWDEPVANSNVRYELLVAGD